MDYEVNIFPPIPGKKEERRSRAAIRHPRGLGNVDGPRLVWIRNPRLETEVVRCWKILCVWVDLCF